MIELDPSSILLQSLTPESKKRLEEIRSQKAEKNFMALLEEASGKLDDNDR